MERELAVWNGKEKEREERRSVMCTSRVRSTKEKKVARFYPARKGEGMGANFALVPMVRTWVRRTASPSLSSLLLSLFIGVRLRDGWRAFGMSIMLPPSEYNGKPAQYHPLLQLVAYLKAKTL